MPDNAIAMLMYAGIDEAGYGPMLGPLCVASAVFSLPEECETGKPPNMWKLLRSGVCRGKSDKKHRIAIDDSKKLKGSNSAKSQHPLRHLERGVLAMLSSIETDTAPTDDDLYEQLGVSASGASWYRTSTKLPVANDAGLLSIASSRLRRCMNRVGVSVTSLTCEAIDAAEFNEQVQRMGTKAAVNFGAAMRAVDRIWAAHGAHHPRIMIDRHGGRTHYREELQLAFPAASIAITAETPRVSRYVLEDAARGAVTVSFETEADARHLPVALASMTAKYVRELMMMRMNRFFGSHLPELKPTAGYVTDARRYLHDIEPVIRGLDIDMRTLRRVV